MNSISSSLYLSCTLSFSVHSKNRQKFAKIGSISDAGISIKILTGFKWRDNLSMMSLQNYSLKIFNYSATSGFPLRPCRQRFLYKGRLTRRFGPSIPGLSIADIIAQQYRYRFQSRSIKISSNFRGLPGAARNTKV